MILALALLAPRTEGQVRRWVTMPFTKMEYTPYRAAAFWEVTRHANAQDTTFLVYNKQSIWWKLSDTMNVQIRIDTITGRGDSRKATLTYFLWQLNVNQVEMMVYTSSFELTYTPPLRDPIWQARVTQDTSRYASWHLVGFPGSVLTISMDKVYGDPTRNKGLDQQVKLRFKWHEKPPATWWPYLDSLRRADSLNGFKLTAPY